MLLAVINDVLRGCAADMEVLMHFSDAGGIDVDGLACSGSTVCTRSGHSSLVDPCANRQGIDAWMFDCSNDIDMYIPARRGGITCAASGI